MENSKRFKIRFIGKEVEGLNTSSWDPKFSLGSCEEVNSFENVGNAQEIIDLLQELGHDSAPYIGQQQLPSLVEIENLTIGKTIDKSFLFERSCAGNEQYTGYFIRRI